MTTQKNAGAGSTGKSKVISKEIDMKDISMNTKLRIISAAQLMTQNPSVEALRTFADDLAKIACRIIGKENQQVAYDIIRPHRPYCVERDENGQWFVKDRGYTTLVKIPLTDADIGELGFEAWYASDACKYATSFGNWPILEDAFDVRYLLQAVALIHRIADCFEKKGGV